MTTAALALLAVAGALFLVRVLVGPSVVDRVIALDALLIVVASGLAVNAASTGRTTFVDAAVVVGLLGFVGTGVAARFIERRGA
ncbi:MAG TPA: monovalent cation/H+ antiporter complex subunit F [Acidimicrobiales bacterium]